MRVVLGTSVASFVKFAVWSTLADGMSAFELVVASSDSLRLLLATTLAVASTVMPGEYIVSSTTLAGESVLTLVLPSFVARKFAGRYVASSELIKIESVFQAVLRSSET